MLRALLDPTRWPLPGGCQICLAWGRDRLCSDCLARFAPPAPRCPRLRAGAAGAALRRLPARAPASGRDRVRCGLRRALVGLLHGLKYQEQLSAAPALAALLATAVQRAGARTEGVLLLPVPLHAQRLAERGHNQSQRLALALGQALGLPLAPSWVQRVADTAPQAQAPSREARWRQLTHAFALLPRAEVTGRHLALVDDVMTTGATMSALATLLRRHGAASVQAWAVARTPRPHD